MHIGVTGGTGFIGEALVKRHLMRGDSVRILSRRLPETARGSVSFFQGDLERATTAELRPFAEGLDVLYHCAGVIRSPQSMHSVHVRGTSALANAAAGAIGRWVQLSSVGAYGSHRTGAVTELTPETPAGEYEVTKAAADQIVLTQADNAAFQAVVLRPSNVFGASMTNNSLRQLIHMIATRLFFFIGTPGASANYIHVESVVDSLLLCATAPRLGYSVYNVSEHRTLEAFVQLIAEALGRHPPKLRIPLGLAHAIARLGSFVPHFPLTPARVEALTLRSYYPTQRIVADLSYRPSVSVEEGIRECVATWYR